MSRVAATAFALLTALLLPVAAQEPNAAGAGAADQPLDIVEALPRTYTGEFRWLAGGPAQKVDIRINSVTRRDENTVEATGCGRYDVVGRITTIRVTMTINSTNRAVEIWELDPVGSAPFSIDGSHRGKLSDDLKTIQTLWLHRPDWRIGSLQLRAGGSLSCAVEVSLQTS